MEVKINREIRNYTEAMFFWTVFKTVHFFRIGLRCSGRNIFFAETVCRNGDRVMDVYFGSGSVRSPWVC